MAAKKMNLSASQGAAFKMTTDDGRPWNASTGRIDLTNQGVTPRRKSRK
jgi:hypothetical protein